MILVNNDDDNVNCYEDSFHFLEGLVNFQRNFCPHMMR